MQYSSSELRRFDSSDTDESHVDETHVWFTKWISLCFISCGICRSWNIFVDVLQFVCCVDYHIIYLCVSLCWNFLRVCAVFLSCGVLILTKFNIIMKRKVQLAIKPGSMNHVFFLMSCSKSGLWYLLSIGSFLCMSEFCNSYFFLFSLTVDVFPWV